MQAFRVARPQRIQLQRRKGFRLPPHTVNVARPSRWGNPFRLAPVQRHPDGTQKRPGLWCRYTAPEVVGRYQDILRVHRKVVHWAHVYHDRASANHVTKWNSLDDIRDHLGGQNLACWCSRGTPCHANLLLLIANWPNPDSDEFRAMQFTAYFDRARWAWQANNGARFTERLLYAAMGLDGGHP